MSEFTPTPDHPILNVARLAAERSPGWSELLAGWHDHSTHVGIPVVDKADLFGSARSPRDLLATPGLEGLAHLLLSSGSSGEARSWSAMTEACLAREQRRLTRALVDVWGVAPASSLLVINALPAGPSLGLPGSMSVSTGPDRDAVVELLRGWAKEFERVLMVGEPWFVKAALEHARAADFELASINLSLALGGEWLPEGLRSYLAELCNFDVEAEPGRILSSLGCGEAGLHLGWETAATTLLRRVAEREELACLCGRALAVAPCFMTYDPEAFFVEFVGSELVLTSLDPERALPLIRYRLGDRGGFVEWERARALLRRTQPELAEVLPKPLIWLAGRSREPWVPVFAEALAAQREDLVLLTGAFFLSADGSRLSVQLSVDEAPAWRQDRIATKLRAELNARGVTPPAIELCASARYPHEGNPWTRKYRRWAR